MLALVAFVELVAVGVALALKNQQGAASNEPVVVERFVKEYVPVAVSTPGALPEPVVAPQEPREAAIPKPFTNEKEILALDTQGPALPLLDAPPIADPIVERLVEEARLARVGGNVRGAIVKLEEAEKLAPEDPTVLYLSADVFEAMGVYEKAADYYQKVFELSPQKAGNLFQLASEKLSLGFDDAQRMDGKLALGRIREFRDKRVEVGERIVLTVPVVVAPNQKIDPHLVEVTVLLYDKLGGEVHQALNDSKIETKYVTEPADWQGTGEELLQVSYFIPPPKAIDQHLLGERKYCGYITELRYDGELLDQQAWPRILAREANVPERNPLVVPPEFLPEDLNLENPLLPPLPRK